MVEFESKKRSARVGQQDKVMRNVMSRVAII